MKVDYDFAFGSATLVECSGQFNLNKVHRALIETTCHFYWYFHFTDYLQRIILHKLVCFFLGLVRDFTIADWAYSADLSDQTTFVTGSRSRGEPSGHHLEFRRFIHAGYTTSALMLMLRSKLSSDPLSHPSSFYFRWSLNLNYHSRFSVVVLLSLRQHFYNQKF